MSIEIIEVRSNGLAGISTIDVRGGSSDIEIVEIRQGPAGAAATVDQTIIDGSTNAVSGNAVFDGLALKAPTANPTFTGIVTAPRITGRCDGLEVFCKAGLAINAGQVVYVTGAAGNNIIIGLAQANTEPTSSKTIGISESTLALNATGYAITEGLLTVSISAPSAVEGDPIWLSPTTAGGMVFGSANKPSAPNHIVYLGVVTRKTGNTVVEIYVKIQNGAELDELSDVAITSPVAGQALMRGATLWENRSLVATDISNSTTAGRDLLTAADAAAQRTSLGLATVATTGAYSDLSGTPTLGNSASLNVGTTAGTVAAGDDARFTDERVPTAAGLTSKFGTNKATVVDADKVAILDSAASDAPKHGLFSAVWAYIKAKIESVTLSTVTISGDLTVDTSTLKVNSTNNRVGIGTSSPASTLEISTGGTTNIKFGTGSAAGYNAFTLNGNLTDGNAVGFIGGGGSDTNFYLNCGNAGDMYFRTGNGSSFANKLVLKNNGKIGLNGNASPSGYLDFGATVPNIGQILNIYNASNLVSGLGMDSGTANLRLYSPSSGFIDFGNISTGNGTTFASNMRLDVANSRLGIGVSSPSTALDVNGTISFDANSGTWNGATIAGNQTFSGQTELTGQSATNSTSAMTRGLADSRYLSPRMIPGVTIHLEANELLYQGTATPTDGSEVVSWKSAHRNGTSEISVVQAGAGLKPLFKTSVQNSLNGVLFDGSNDLLQSATGFNGFVSNTGRTVFVVCRPTIQVATGSGTSYQRPQLFSNQGQFNGISVSPSGAGNIFTMWDYDTAGSLIQASSAVVAVNTAVVVTSRHQTGTSMMQVNQATPVTATTLRECTNGSPMQIGTAGGSAYYTGYIFEMITFGRALSDYEIAAVQSNLITKWGIS